MYYLKQIYDMLMVLMQGDSSKYLYIKFISNVKLREQWMLFLWLLHVFGEATDECNKAATA